MESGGVTVKIDVRGEIIDLDPKTELTMYRAAQEGLTNVHKHAQDKLVDLTLDFRDPTQVRLSIADNGRGFQTANMPDGHYGLVGINERVHLLGGNLDLHAANGIKDGVSARLPFVRTVFVPMVVVMVHMVKKLTKGGDNA